MDFGRLFSTVRTLSKENQTPSAFVFLDMLWCGLRYGAGYVDYLIFDFIRLSGKQRRTFVTRGINNEFIRKLNNKENYYKFEDKAVFNSIFKEYIGRNWVSLKETSADGLAQFLEVNPVVIVKPIDSICGKGIEKIYTEDCDSGELYERLIKNGQLLVEECITQHDEVAAINPASVNTVRLMTIAGDGKVYIMFRALRLGVGDSVVDNFNAGGLFVLLDENGVIVTDAVNKKTEIFHSHPTTGVVFKGTQIPFFEETELMISKAALRGAEEGIRYISWDIAVTPSGPVVVEANHNPGYDLLQSKVYLTDNEFGRRGDFKNVIQHICNERK